MKSMKWNRLSEICVFRRILIFLLTFVATFSILATSLITEKYTLDVGGSATTDIKAPREITDKEATQTKINEAKNSVTDLFKQSAAAKTEANTNMKNIFDKIILLKDSSADEKSKINDIKQVAGQATSLEDDECKILLTLSKDDLLTISKELNYIVSDLTNESP